MTSILQIIDSGDVFSLLALIAVLALVGQKMVQENQFLYVWGWRFATAAFLCYCIYTGYVLQPATARAWLGVVFRGLLAAGLALGLAWICLSVGAFVHHHLFRAPLTKLRNLPMQWRGRRGEKRYRENQQELDRLRLKHQAEESCRKREQEDTAAEAKRRRTAARAQAILEYSLYAAKMRSERFTREMLNEYLGLLDDASPEDVDHHLKALTDTLGKHVREVEGPEREPLTLDELQSWRQAEIQRIQESTADDRLKRRLIAALNVRFSELATGIIEDTEP